MESHAVRRRLNTISAHLGAALITEDVTSPTTHLFPLNCSSSLSTTFRRLDSSLLYGRQASASQGYFMRQALSSMEQQGNPLQTGLSCGNKINEKKPTASPPPLYSRLGAKEPLFARPEAESYSCDDGLLKSAGQEKMVTASQCPKFTRPVEEFTETKNLSCKSPIVTSQINGVQWSPRINVAESKRNHAITVELPGVNIRDIRVEMDNKNLIVRGKRSMRSWNTTGCSNDSSATYHKREISQGPYQVVWPLPAGANKDCISAEFMEGILQITIPKL